MCSRTGAGVCFSTPMSRVPIAGGREENESVFMDNWSSPSQMKAARSVRPADSGLGGAGSGLLGKVRFPLMEGGYLADLLQEADGELAKLVGEASRSLSWLSSTP